MTATRMWASCSNFKLDRAMIRGVALGIAEMVRCGGDYQSAETAVVTCGLTMANLRAAGAAEYDLETLAKVFKRISAREERR